MARQLVKGTPDLVLMISDLLHSGTVETEIRNCLTDVGSAVSGMVQQSGNHSYELLSAQGGVRAWRHQKAIGAALVTYSVEAYGPVSDMIEGKLGDLAFYLQKPGFCRIGGGYRT